MKKLWVFGDSFSCSYSVVYNNWKGYKTKIFSDFIIEKLKLTIKNESIVGCSNRTILSQFVNVMDKINDEDIIIINWTEINRHRIIHNNKLFDIVPFETTELVKNLTIPNHAIIEYAVNRIDSFAFYSEINEYIKLIKKSKSNNLIINWTWCYFENPKNEFIEFIDNMDFYGSLETISHETNENIRDWHYSENAHKLLSDIFIEIISNPTERKKYRLETHDPIFRPDINSNSFTIKKLL